MLDLVSQEFIDMKRSLRAIWANDEEFQKLLDMVNRTPDAVYAYYDAQHLCQTFGCEMPGGWVGASGEWAKKLAEGSRAGVHECATCTRPLLRCRRCWLKFCGINHCAYCTGTGGSYQQRFTYHGHVDEEWDIDANGGYSNARRDLEELR